MLTARFRFLRTLGYSALYAVAMVTGTATLMTALMGTGEAPGARVERVAAKAANCTPAPGAARNYDDHDEQADYVYLCRPA
ncbi:MAG: hypothetical protein KF686_04285 [Ramlibacter sp.]|nr:hypothetical protein [Ramlibacter sp.]